MRAALSRIALFSLAFIPALLFAAPTQEFSISDLSGGLNTYASPNQIPDNAAVSLENVYTDQEKLFVERNGYQKRDATILGGTKSIPGLWEFVDSSGNDWIISFSSRTFYKNTSATTPTAFGPNPTADTIPDCVAHLGKFWCTNAADPGWYFDGTTTATVAGMPRGTLLEAWRTRLVVANITGSQSTVRFSADGDGTSWTLGGNPTDPFALQIGGANDGRAVTCLWGSYLDNLVIGQKRSLWYASGFDQSDIEVRNVSSEIGCLQNGTMREFDGSLLFLSNRGMEEAQGYTIKNISEPIRNIIDPIVKNTQNTRSSPFTTSADWALGTSTPTSQQLSSSLISGSLSNKTTTFNLTANTDFGNGTFDNTVFVDTETSPGDLQTTFPDPFNAFRDGTSSTKQVWTKWANGTTTSLFAASGGVMNLHASNAGSTGDAGMRTVNATNKLNGTTIYFDITENTNVPPSVWPRMYFIGNPTAYTNTSTAFNSGATRFSIEWDRGICAANQFEFNSFSTDGTDHVLTSTCYTAPVSVKILLNNAETSLTINGSSTIFRGTGLTTSDLSQRFYLYFGNITVSQTDVGSKIDNFAIIPETFTWTSPVLDTGISSPTWNNSAIGANGVSVQAAFSDDNVSYGAPATLSDATKTNLQIKRYLKFSGALSTDGSTSTIVSISSIQVNAASSATYTSPAIFLSSAITTYGPVLVNDLKGGSGSISYQFNTSSYTVFTATNWTNVLPGGTPTNAVRNFIQFRAVFNVTSGTDTLSVQDFTPTWNEGAVQPAVSWNYDRRYWLAYTTSTVGGATNDRVLVYQRNRTWTLLTGINAASFATWKDGFYFGNSNATGYAYNFDSGTDDDGAPIVTTLTTKSYDLGQPIRRKDLKYLYAYYKGNTSNTGSFLVNYDLDQSGGLNAISQEYSLGTASLNEGTGSVLAKMPFPLYVTAKTYGREIQYKFKKTGGERFKLYGLTTLFELMAPE